jgi:hypothetical protein
MQDREKKGCWYITKGYVFNQEPGTVRTAEQQRMFTRWVKTSKDP